MKLNKILVLTAVTGMTFLGGCKKFLDVNNNPNITQNASVEVVLPSAQVALAHAMGNNLQINGGFWSQYWTQSPLSSQYKYLDQYQPSTDNYDRPWSILYAEALRNFKYVYDKSVAENKRQYAAIAKIMMAYTFQVITDAWGDVPYSEALMGSYDDGAIISPKYDAQKDIYAGIQKMADEALAIMDSHDPTLPGSDDLVFHGDMDSWIKFANTLKLKAYLRLSEIDPTSAAAGIQSLEEATATFLDDVSGDAGVKFSQTGGNENPLFSEMVGLNRTKNIYASATSVDYLTNIDDPRLSYFYIAATGNPASLIVGITQGDYNNSVTATGKAIASMYVGAAVFEEYDEISKVAPVIFFSMEESMFLQAEAMARGWMTGDAGATYNSAISGGILKHEAHIDLTMTMSSNTYSSLSEWVDTLLTHPDVAYPTAGTLQDQIKAIATQKWVAMCGTQGFEAWTEWRRTGYPDFFSVSLNSLIGNNFPQRFLYPTDEISRNANFPGLKTVDQKVWWDKN